MTPQEPTPDPIRAAAVRAFLREIQNPSRCPRDPSLAQLCTQVVELLPMMGVSLGLMIPAGPLPDEVAEQLFPLCHHLGSIWEGIIRQAYPVSST